MGEQQGKQPGQSPGLGKSDIPKTKDAGHQPIPQKEDGNGDDNRENSAHDKRQDKNQAVLPES